MIKGKWSGIPGKGNSVKVNFWEHLNLFLRNKGTTVNFHREQGNMRPPGNISCLSHYLEQILWVCSLGTAKSFPKLNNPPPSQEKKKCQNCTIPPGFPRGVPGINPWKSINDECITCLGLPVLVVPQFST